MRASATLRHDSGSPWPLDVRLLNLGATVLFAVAGLLALGLLLTWLIRQPVFSVRAVKVDGDVTRNSASTIRANALPRLSGNYFTFDLARGKEAFETVPWVRQAVVRRVWPNRLAVTLEEHQAAAFWAVKDADDQLVNQQGEVFEVNLGDVEDEALPRLEGPPGTSAEVLAMHRRLSPAFAALDMRIDTLSLNGRGSWHAEFEDGAEIELGRGNEDEVAERADRFIATVSQVIERYQRPLLFADLRHHEGYALRLKGITTSVSTPAGNRR